MKTILKAFVLSVLISVLSVIGIVYASEYPDTFLYSKHTSKENVEYLYESAYNLYNDARYDKIMDLTSTDYRRNPFVVIGLPDTGVDLFSTRSVMENRQVNKVVRHVEKEIEVILKVACRTGQCYAVIQEPPGDLPNEAVRGTLYYMCTHTIAKWINPEYIGLKGDESQAFLAAVQQVFSGEFDFENSYAAAINRLMHKYHFPFKKYHDPRFKNKNILIDSYSLVETAILWHTQPKLKGRFKIYVNAKNDPNAVVLVYYKKKPKLSKYTEYNRVTINDIRALIKKYKKIFESNNEREIKKLLSQWAND